MRRRPRRLPPRAAEITCRPTAGAFYRRPDREVSGGFAPDLSRSLRVCTRFSAATGVNWLTSTTLSASTTASSSPAHRASWSGPLGCGAPGRTVHHARLAGEAVLLRLDVGQYGCRPLDHLRRHSRQTRDVQPVGLVRAAGVDPVKEQDLVLPFLDRHAPIRNPREGCRQTGQLVVVGGKERQTPVVLVQAFDDRPGQRQPVVCRRARPTSSSTTRLSRVAWRRMFAVSTISTMKVDSPRARSSLAPTRVKIRSTRPISALPELARNCRHGPGARISAVWRR